MKELEKEVREAERGEEKTWRMRNIQASLTKEKKTKMAGGKKFRKSERRKAKVN